MCIKPEIESLLIPLPGGDTLPAGMVWRRDKDARWMSAMQGDSHLLSG
jgi:hypothetical protein